MTGIASRPGPDGEQGVTVLRPGHGGARMIAAQVPDLGLEYPVVERDRVATIPAASAALASRATANCASSCAAPRRRSMAVATARQWLTAGPVILAMSRLCPARDSTWYAPTDHRASPPPAAGWRRTRGTGWQARLGLLVRPRLAERRGGRRRRFRPQRVWRGGEHGGAQRLLQQHQAAVAVDQADVVQAGERGAAPAGPVRTAGCPGGEISHRAGREDRLGYPRGPGGRDRQAHLGGAARRELVRALHGQRPGHRHRARRGRRRAGDLLKPLDVQLVVVTAAEPGARDGRAGLDKRKRVAAEFLREVNRADPLIWIRAQPGHQVGEALVRAEGPDA